MADSAPKPRPKKESEVDSDGEEIHLCNQCGLPVGETAYRPEEKDHRLVHAECMAQIVLQEAQDKDDKSAEEQRQKKLENRLEYQIGWRPETVPKNSTIAEKLGCSPLPQGLCSLVLDEASRTVRIASTLEPSAAVNLEYLMLCLKVRRTACREPLFSLDPVDPKNLEKTPQMKRYEPAWLAGTSVGDVMFQADYFLKELALGEYTMPVVGMMIVFDWSEVTDSNATWAGREWFVVKKAEVRMAEDKTLVPFVKMGVEAREQTVTSKGLEDKAITSKNHPLTRFADTFTRHFDLIAERKSVIFHLRELAKASVMAKYLIDAKIAVDPRWYDLAEDMVRSTVPEAHPEIPQLWNMRGNSRIQLQGGKLRDVQTGLNSNLHAIYGGVQFGLDRFQLAQRPALPGTSMVPSAGLGGPMPGAALTQPGRFDIQGMQLGPTGRPMFMPQRFQLTQKDQPQGVDLDLDKFDLTSPEKFASNLPACSASFDSLEGRVTLGKAFLTTLQEGSFESLAPENCALLKQVFNILADRTAEGDSFIPPDPNLEYVQKLRNLVQEENTLGKQRKTRFSDKNFTVGMAGMEFPRAWTSRFQLLREGRAYVAKPSLVSLQVDDIFKRSLLEDILPTAAPEFYKTTEDGMAFRIYRLGRLEVRTVQAPGEDQEILAVFSLRPVDLPSHGGSNKVRPVLPDEKFVKGRLYVEALDGDHKEAAKQLHLCHFYVVLDTEKGNCVVTEKLADGTTTWVVNPSCLEDRNSLAKVMVCLDIRMEKATVRNLQITQESHSIKSSGASPSERKRYARAIFSLVSPRSLEITGGRRYVGRAYPYPSSSKRSGEFRIRGASESPGGR
ncbi:unnamed protein product [Effrenium voratum]|uniref:Uncharacterized protein n=1 Tax=Effrenium voratum TaxID=2562239 RepID=A0AA36IK14_9DINO|nr:unnamed protein product [Effrenium voratum]